MRTLALFLLLTVPLSAQWIVNDPVNTAVNAAVQAGQAANHIETMRQWARQLENLNRQLRQLQDQLAVQQHIRDVMGDPHAAGNDLILRDLGANNLARTYGETLQATRRLANAIDSLRRTAGGIYRELDDHTVLGRAFVRDDTLYRRYAVVDRQVDTLGAVNKATETRRTALQADLADTIERLRNASTQAETDKLNATIAVLNGQLADVNARRRDAADRLVAAQIQNENQAAKERQDFLEKQQAEGRDSVAAMNAWQSSLKLTATRYDQP